MRQPDAAEQAETPIYCLGFVRVGGGGLMRWGWGALGIAPGLPLPRRINTAILGVGVVGVAIATSYEQRDTTPPKLYRAPCSMEWLARNKSS